MCGPTDSLRKKNRVTHVHNSLIYVYAQNLVYMLYNFMYLFLKNQLWRVQKQTYKEIIYPKDKEEHT